MQKIKITVVIPALNEENSIEPLVRSLLNDNHLKDLITQIILVNDGSTDKTLEKMKEINSQYPNIQIISFKNNHGIGYSLKKAVQIIKDGYVLWLPSDGEFSTCELSKIIGAADGESIIISYPDNSKEIRDKFRYLLSCLYTSILNSIFNLNVKYYNGITLYPVHLVKSIEVRSNRFSFCSELLLKSLHLTNHYTQIPVKLTKRDSGESKAITLASFVDVFVNFVKFTIDLKSLKR